MFRLWGKIWKDNHLLKDTVICDDSEDTRTHKIFRGLESICYEMDLGNPIWLESTVRHFKKHGKARFYQDNFIEQIDFEDRKSTRLNSSHIEESRMPSSA